MSANTSGFGNIIAWQQRHVVQLTGRILPALARRAGAGGELLRRSIKKLEIRLNGFDRTIAVKPVADIPYPALDLADCDNPVAAIMASPEFDAARAFFLDNPVTARSLETPTAHALLYCIVRNLRPDHIFEIGTYRAGTTEAICRALLANGHGIAHSVDPFTGDYVEAVLKHWPPELKRHLKLYPMNSMTFYAEMRRQKIQPGLVFVDGEHDYEYALFDIGCAARVLAPRGFLFIDNVDQVGPFLATHDFLAVNPAWRELGSALRRYDPEKGFDRQRNLLPDTPITALHSPHTQIIDERPRNFGIIRRHNNRVAGLRLRAIAPRQPGRLIVQTVLRGFDSGPKFEIVVEATTELHPGATEPIDIAFDPPPALLGGLVYYTVEPWLIWRGQEPLQLLQPPEPY
jgi:predicted O-methyltransferase YrrM